MSSGQADDESTLGDRVEEAIDPFRARLEAPVERVTTLTRRIIAWFPVRVWLNFLTRNGFLLSAGISYMALFAIFAALAAVFSVAGIWLVSQPRVLDALIEIINTYVPALIGGDDAVITRQQLEKIAGSSTFSLSLTGVVALGGLIWTSISWITYSRVAVRSIFGLPRDDRAFLLLKARDLLVALLFGITLIVAALLSVASTQAFDWVLGLLGINSDSTLVTVASRATGLLVVVILNTAVLATMYRLMAGAAVAWRRLATGSVIGGAAMGLSQVGGGALFGTASRNPLLATFAVFIGLLLWFNVTSIITLVAASWIATSAGDRGQSLRRVSEAELEAERHEREQDALVLAARVRLRDARTAVRSAAWWERPSTRAKVRRAEHRLEQLEPTARDDGGN